MTWDDFHFLRPAWLAAAAACAVLGVVLHRRRARRSAWTQVMDPALARALVRGPSGPGAIGAVACVWAMLAVGCVALAGPSWTRQLPDDLQDRAAVIVLLRNAASMYAGDVAPNRNRAAKARIEALRARLPQSAFAVIAYAGTAHLVIPPTRDDDFFRLFLAPLEPDVMPAATAPRTGLGQALDLAREAARGAGLPANVVLMTDALSDAEGTDLRAFHAQFPSLEVLVVGTAGGGALRFAPGGVPVPERTAVPVDTFAALKDDGVAVMGATADDGDVRWLVRQVRGTLVRTHNADGQWPWQDAGHVLLPVLLAVGLLLQRRLRALGVAAPLALLLATQAPDAHAAWTDLWWTPDQQGQRALDRGDYRAAAARFDDPYRRGRAAYLAEDFEAAAAAFRRVPTAEGWFYLGNSLARQRKFQAARDAYRHALALDPGMAAATANAHAVQGVLDELAKRPSERQAADPADTDVTAIRIDPRARRRQDEAGPGTAPAMSDDELAHWMANVTVSPKAMLKALFLLQAQDRAKAAP